MGKDKYALFPLGCSLIDFQHYYSVEVVKLPCEQGIVLVLYTPIIKYIFEIHLSRYCSNGKENKEALKRFNSAVRLLYSFLLNNL